MLLEYNYKPEDILGKGIDIYFYGAGTGVSSYSRIGIAALKAFNLKPYAFIDDNFLLKENKLFGINVLTPSKAKTLIEQNANKYIIIVTSNYFDTIIESIDQFKLSKKSL